MPRAAMPAGAATARTRTVSASTRVFMTGILASFQSSYARHKRFLDRAETLCSPRRPTTDGATMQAKRKLALGAAVGLALAGAGGGIAATGHGKTQHAIRDAPGDARHGGRADDLDAAAAYLGI